MTGKTFILGVGAQKSGTTWLHRYIDSNDNVDMGPVKEYHVWDAPYHELGSQKRSEFPMKTLISSIRTTLLGGLGSPNKPKIRAKFRDDHELYFEFFKSRLKQKKITITGDITPSYSALPLETLEIIKEGFAKRDIQVRVIFLMRDPVERAWSSMRMSRRKGYSNDADLLLDDQTNLRNFVQTPYAKMIGNYPETISNLEKVFAPAEIHFGIYEKMFEAEEVERLSAFVGVPVRQSFARRVINSGGKQRLLNPEIVGDIRAEFPEVYDFCERRFPETKALWHRPKPEDAL